MAMGGCAVERMREHGGRGPGKRRSSRASTLVSPFDFRQGDREIFPCLRPFGRAVVARNLLHRGPIGGNRCFEPACPAFPRLADMRCAAQAVPCARPVGRHALVLLQRGPTGCDRRMVRRAAGLPSGPRPYLRAAETPASAGFGPRLRRAGLGADWGAGCGSATKARGSAFGMMP